MASIAAACNSGARGGVRAQENQGWFSLYLHHHRQNHRPAVGLLVEKLAERVANLIFDERPVGSVAVETDERVQYLLASAGKQLFRVAHIDEAARNNVGTRQRLSGLFIDGQDRKST